MAGAVTFKVEGFKEMDAALQEYRDSFDASKATTKNILKRAAMDALVPMADAAEANAPVLTGHLRDSIAEGTRLTSRQARLNKARDDASTVNVFMGPDDPGAVAIEFGTFDQPARPFLRPAFQSEAQGTIQRLSGSLKGQLDKATVRAQRKALRKAV